MTYLSVIMVAAKIARISGALLVAICTHETNLTNIVAYHDGHSPSYGLCQVKFETATMIGFKGKAEDLIIPTINAKWAAKYLKHQEKRYNGDWCKMTSAYNAGSYNESKKLPGKPRNLKYVRGVQKKLQKDLRYKLSCDGTKMAS